MFYFIFFYFKILNAFFIMLESIYKMFKFLYNLLLNVKNDLFYTVCTTIVFLVMLKFLFLPIGIVIFTVFIETILFMFLININQMPSLYSYFIVQKFLIFCMGLETYYRQNILNKTLIVFIYAILFLYSAENAFVYNIFCILVCLTILYIKIRDNFFSNQSVIELSLVSDTLKISKQKLSELLDSKFHIQGHLKVKNLHDFYVVKISKRFVGSDPENVIKALTTFFKTFGWRGALGGSTAMAGYINDNVVREENDELKKELQEANKALNQTVSDSLLPTLEQTKKDEILEYQHYLVEKTNFAKKILNDKNNVFGRAFHGSAYNDPQFRVKYEEIQNGSIGVKALLNNVAPYCPSTEEFKDDPQDISKIPGLKKETPRWRSKLNESEAKSGFSSLSDQQKTDLTKNSFNPNSSEKPPFTCILEENHYLYTTYLSIKKAIFLFLDNIF